MNPRTTSSGAAPGSGLSGSMPTAVSVGWATCVIWMVGDSEGTVLHPASATATASASSAGRGRGRLTAGPRAAPGTAGGGGGGGGGGAPPPGAGGGGGGAAPPPG